MRLLAAGLVAVSASLITTTVVGAQSVPVDDDNAPVGAPPQSPVEPPAAPVAPPSNDGGAGNAGTAPSSGLPSTGSGGAADEPVVAAGVAALILGAAGVTTIGIARRSKA